MIQDPLPATADPRRAERGSACAIKLPTFEGPLDLLLHLIRSNEVDIHDIPIASISAQYLEYLEMMEDLDIELASDYLVMAATLAYIKSRMMLPSDPDLDEEDGEDPREELARRLAEYAIFKDAALDLDRLPRLGRDVFAGRAEMDAVEAVEPVLTVSLFALLEAMRQVIAQRPEGEAVHQVSLEQLTLQDRIVYVLDRLCDQGEGAMLFEDLLSDAPPSRHRVVMTFLAILELARIQALRIFQNVRGMGEPFGPVRVRLAVLEGDTSSSAAEEHRGG